MSNKRDYNETIRDISLLYELSLSVGKSLDVKINCDVFLKTLMSRKNLTYVSVWIKNEYFADEKDKCVTLIYANPSFRVREKYLRLNHPIFSLLQENDAVSISSTGDRFPEIITEKGIVKGTFAIFALGKIGILKLFSIAKESPFEERELNQLRNVISQFTNSLEGCLAHRRLLEDIAKRKQAEEALKKAKEELEKQNIELQKVDKIKDSLIRDVTHELKTPVAKHCMQLEILEGILQKHNLMDKAQDAIGVMKASIKRQETVICNILDLSRLEAGGRKYKREEVHVDKILKEIIEDYHYYMDIYKIKTIMELEEVTVQSDGEMLAHVFSNIINNAIKYRKRDVQAEINISCKKEEKAAKIEIADNGIGLSEEEKEKAFDRFYQVSPSAEGSGIGLAISKMIVDDLGGRIWLESAGKGRGTTAIMQLPL